MQGAYQASLEGRHVAAEMTAFQSSDWRNRASPIPPLREKPVPPVSVRAKGLYVRALPTSHHQEKERASSIISAGHELLQSCSQNIKTGNALVITELSEFVEAVIASLLRDPLAFPSVARLRQWHTYTYAHSVAVCGLMVALGSELQLDPQLIRDLGIAGLLHDIGKTNISPGLLDKIGVLSAEDTATLRGHPEAGYEILKDIPGLPPVVLDVCRHHHERPDGLGYPHSLAGSTLSQAARIASICNFYDKMTCPNIGTIKWSPGQAIEYLRSASDEFDNRIALRFIRTIGTFLPGVLVRLSSERLAIILDETEANPMHPVVGVFQDICGRSIPWQRVCSKSDPILSIERPNSWNLTDWVTLRSNILGLSQ